MGRSIAWTLALLALVSAAGCDRSAPLKPRTGRGGDSAQLRRSAGTELDQAMAFLFRIDEFDPTQARAQIHLHLNDWIKKQRPDPEWQHDPMFDRLDRQRFPDVPDSSSLRVMQFQLFDTYMLQEAVWMRDISSWVVAAPLRDPLLAPWFEQLASERSADHVERVAEAAKLFDWVVRNIRLDTTRSEQPGEPFPPGALSEQRLRNADGTMFPWESLLLGHGDFIERARVFIHLTRQRGLPAVMFGVPEPATDSIRPWAVGVLVENDFYLFEPRLGIPIPSGWGGAPAAASGGDEGSVAEPSASAAADANGDSAELTELKRLAELNVDAGRFGIARLANVVTDPQLVTALYEDDDAKGLSVSRQEIQRLVALIDATPTYLSQRMKLLESQLSGERKVVLSFAATPLRRQIERLPGVSQVRLWMQPFEVLRFQRELPEHQALLSEMLEERLPFDSRTPLAQGRIRHIRGQLVDTKDEPGAKKFYLEAREFNEQAVRAAFVKRVERAKLEADPTADPRLTPEEMTAVESGVQMARRVAERTRIGASHWLGLVCFDNGEYRVARDLFSKRVLDINPDTEWRHSAHYNLARSEQMWALETGDAEVARTAIERMQNPLPDDPQATGNRWRARRMQAAATASARSPAGTADADQQNP